MLYQNLEIDPTALPDLDEATYQKHPLRYKGLRMLRVGILFTFLLVPIVAPVVQGEFKIFFILLGAWAALFLLVLIGEHLSFKIRGYVLREKDITYQKGFFRYVMVTVPFNRIQHSEIVQGPIGKTFNISALKIYTAGGSSSDLTIGGLPPEEAQRLKDFITQSAEQHA
jgi:uncharacterized protein